MSQDALSRSPLPPRASAQVLPPFLSPVTHERIELAAILRSPLTTCPKRRSNARSAEAAGASRAAMNEAAASTQSASLAAREILRGVLDSGRICVHAPNRVLQWG